MELMNGNPHFKTIRFINLNDITDIIVPTLQRKHVNEIDINLNYQLTSCEHQCPCVIERDYKWSNIKSFTCWIFVFCSKTHYRSRFFFVAFYRAHESSAPSGYQPLQLFIVTRFFFLRYCILHRSQASPLNHQQLKSNLHLLLPTSCSSYTNWRRMQNDEP